MMLQSRKKILTHDAAWVQNRKLLVYKRAIWFQLNRFTTDKFVDIGSFPYYSHNTAEVKKNIVIMTKKLYSTWSRGLYRFTQSLSFTSVESCKKGRMAVSNNTIFRPKLHTLITFHCHSSKIPWRCYLYTLSWKKKASFMISLRRPCNSPCCWTPRKNLRKTKVKVQNKRHFICSTVQVIIFKRQIGDCFVI